MVVLFEELDVDVVVVVVVVCFFVGKVVILYFLILLVFELSGGMFVLVQCVGFCVVFQKFIGNFWCQFYC